MRRNFSLSFKLCKFGAIFRHTGSGIVVQVEVVWAPPKRKCILALKCFLKMPTYWCKIRRNFSRWFTLCTFGGDFRQTGSGIELQIRIQWARPNRKRTRTSKCCIRMPIINAKCDAIFPFGSSCASLAPFFDIPEVELWYG